MRILQLHSATRFFGGDDTVVQRERDVLERGGHSVDTFVVPNPQRPAEAALTIARAPWNRSAAAAALARAEAFGADAVHVHNWWFSNSAAPFRALHRAGFPTVHTLHNYRIGCLDSSVFRDGHTCTDCFGHSVLAGIRHRCYRDSFVWSAVLGAAVTMPRLYGVWDRYVDVYLAISEEVRTNHLDLGLDPERVVVKPNFTPDPGPRSQPPSASNTVVFVGRLAPGKGVETLLEAWGHGGAAPAGLELEIIGQGPLQAELESMAPPGVRFVGYLPLEEVERRLLEARALVFPSDWLEPFGLVVIEAMAAGLPLVGTTRGVAPEALGSVAPELLVPAADAPAMRVAIDRLRDDALVDRLGPALRARWATDFSPEANLGLLEAAYAKAIATHVRR